MFIKTYYLHISSFDSYLGCSFTVLGILLIIHVVWVFVFKYLVYSPGHITEIGPICRELYCYFSIKFVSVVFFLIEGAVYYFVLRKEWTPAYFGSRYGCRFPPPEHWKFQGSFLLPLQFCFFFFFHFFSGSL